ncbi:Alpha-L-fucosidase [compost metagenome]
MNNKNVYLFSLALLTAVFFSCKNIGSVAPPQPYGAIPSKPQLDWQKMEYYMFVHFGPNTFTDMEWGNGKEDPKIFNPSALDCRQWAATAKAAGMEGIIITAKHHDGFCLWPSKYSTHTVKQSPWKNGKGDVLKELSAACKEYGLKFGVYLSPWDRNHPAYGTPEYNQIFAKTLSEVLTNYGDVFEVWFDGANGEGPNGKRQEYDWDLFRSTVYKHQPNAVIFSDVGPGCRWIGNEAGFAGETNWSRLNVKGFEPGRSPALDTLNSGNRYGAAWVPGETDVSVRPGWFYSKATDEKVKSLDDLLGIYFASVGRNSNLLLNVPADRRGLIHANDSLRLMEVKQALDQSFDKNLAADKKAISKTVRGNSKEYGTANLLDGDSDSYWATDDDVLTAAVEIDLGSSVDVNTVVLQEYIPLGQRVARFNIEVWNANKNVWEEVAKATTIGYKRIIRFKTRKTNKLRLNILESLACPVLNNVGVYHLQEAYLPKEAKQQVVSEKGDLIVDKWKVLSPALSNAAEIIDGKGSSIAVSFKEPIIIDLGVENNFKGFFYVPENKVAAPNITRYNFLVSSDGKNWKALKTNAMFNNIRNNPIRQNQVFENPVKGRYIKLEPLELAHSSDKYLIAEIGLLK